MYKVKVYGILCKIEVDKKRKKKEKSRTKRKAVFAKVMKKKTISKLAYKIELKFEIVRSFDVHLV